MFILQSTKMSQAMRGFASNTSPSQIIFASQYMQITIKIRECYIKIYFAWNSSVVHNVNQAMKQIFSHIILNTLHMLLDVLAQL